MMDRYKARIVARDPAATMLKLLADDAKIAVRPGVKAGDRALACVSELIKQIENDGALFRQVWPVIVAVVENGSVASGEIVRGIAYVESKLGKHSLSDVRWIKRFRSIDPRNLTLAVNQSTTASGNVSPGACARGVLRAINHGLRNPLVVPGLSD
jgi:hypothetical protein